MKIFFRPFLFAAVLALVSVNLTRAQNEPIIKVDITRIGVLSGSGSILSVELGSGGSGYATAPTVTFSGGGGSGASAVATISSAGVVTSLTLTSGGTGYTSLPTVVISPPGTAATATATIGAAPSGVTGITVSGGGSGYTSAPLVTITGGGGTGAAATATVENGAVTGIAITAPGTGYTAVPTVTIAPPGAQATAMAVGLGSIFTAPFQNESYGAVNTTMTIEAVASGIFPVGGFTYNFFVNGQPLGTSTNPQPPGGGPGYVSWAPPQPGSYLLTVVASGGGHTATSLAVRYFATGTAMIGPVDNTLVPVGSSVVMQATATPVPTAPNAFVQRMDFYVDGAKVGTDTTYPYSYIYTPSASPTAHVLEARGFDNNGNQISPDGTATRRVTMVTPIGTPPTVRIVNPPTGANVTSGTQVTILADAAPTSGFIKNVDFYLNGQLLSSSQKFPFQAAWTPQVPGQYEFVAIGFDDKSNAVASAPVIVNATGAFPTATITTPVAGVTVVQGSTLPVAVQAAGADGGITSLQTIEFLVDGAVSDSLPKASPGGLADVAPVLTEPFLFNWKANVALGTHRLSVRVTDKAGLKITSPEVAVTVIANQPPQISISSPSAGATLTVGTAITIAAEAQDTDGTVEGVDFFAGNASIGRATTRPFRISWSPTTAGPVELTARATDNGGATTTSSSIAVTVEPQTTNGDAGPSLPPFTVYRGDYASSTELGRFAFGITRSNRGTFVAFSTNPSGRTYLWSDIPINGDGTFVVRAANDEVLLRGQTSATGVAGNFGDKTFIGPVTPSTAAFSPLLVTGSLDGNASSQVIAIVGGDGVVTVLASSGNSRDAGEGLLTATGTYSIRSPAGGTFAGSVANTASIVSGSSTGSVAGNFLLRLQPTRITNISTRSVAGTGDNTLVAGFVIRGSGSKPLLIRAVGPTLSNFGVARPLANPSLFVQSSTGAALANNDDWGSSTTLSSLFGRVGAFPLTSGSRDAALQTSLAPGTYSAVVGGASSSGTSLVEIYDLDSAGNVSARITNISTRGQVAVGEPLIAGIVISGDQRKRLLIRAVGPTLAQFGISGALADPKLDVISGTTVIASNNDWSEGAAGGAVTEAGPTVGAFALPNGSKDAALVVQLTPGAYTVQVTGPGSSTGVVLVEIYDADL